MFYPGALQDLADSKGKDRDPTATVLIRGESKQTPHFRFCFDGTIEQCLSTAVSADGSDAVVFAVEGDGPFTDSQLGSQRRVAEWLGVNPTGGLTWDVKGEREQQIRDTLLPQLGGQEPGPKDPPSKAGSSLPATAVKKTLPRKAARSRKAGA